MRGLAESRSSLYYHLGLSAAAVFPAVIILLITENLLAFPLIIIAVNLAGLFRTRWMIGLSYHMLKLAGGKGFIAEKTAIHMMTALCRHWVKRPVPANRILILLPHCLQEHTCDRRITHDSSNCLRCGKCPVGDILNLGDRYGTPVAVATGGTLARKRVKESGARAILAVACPRDLSSGMLDAWPVPVIGVENSRPCGDCFDTQVDIQQIEKALKYLTGSEEQP